MEIACDRVARPLVGPESGEQRGEGVEVGAVAKGRRRCRWIR